MSANVGRASKSIEYELSLYAATIPQAHRDEYFHPCNRDMWVATFCEWLAAKQRASAARWASDD